MFNKMEENGIGCFKMTMFRLTSMSGAHGKVINYPVVGKVLNNQTCKSIIIKIRIKLIISKHFT